MEREKGAMEPMEGGEQSNAGADPGGVNRGTSHPPLKIRNFF